MNLKVLLFFLWYSVPTYSFQKNNLPNPSRFIKNNLTNKELSIRRLSPFSDLDHHSLVDCLCSNPYKGIEVVKSISSLLPKLDSIAPQILHANEQIIEATLNNNWIPSEFQKKIVLGSIKYSQFGDNMGSHFLQMYYDLVDKCL
jgi:hypothetical protein